MNSFHRLLCQLWSNYFLLVIVALGGWSNNRSNNTWLPLLELKYLLTPPPYLISTMLWLTSEFKNNFRQFFGDPIECDAGAVRSFFRLSFPHHRSEMYVCTHIEVTNYEKWKSQFLRISWKLYFIRQANAAVEQDVLDSYCWMYSTWNVPRWFTMMLSSNNYCLRKRES